MDRSDPTRLADSAREEALLRLIESGDRLAFETLYGEYFSRLSRFLSRLTRRAEIVEETINDAFWVVWQRAGDFRGDSLVSTWIFGIAYRCALKCLRRNAPAPAGVTIEAGDLAHEPAMAQEREDWLGQALRHLPLEQRMTLEAAYFLGHSCQEIAAIMDCSVGTVKARMFHARVKLRNLLPQLAETTKASPL